MPRKKWRCSNDQSGYAEKTHNSAYEKGVEAEAAVEKCYLSHNIHTVSRANFVIYGKTRVSMLCLNKS
ncbi:hypothetical protein BCR33DRAFT_713141 [Rhizoclosmatium globosum]|uniref:Uncharacterized protein n=1 Tax=Rhizoclosmatium globosum TaxID=329046 RepID=A0A1Y2CTP3_9FUNG|nr:hypothetical protein BCR33DRAFT_713141 [Rhizoclosmatium globosum]|eukprot:ORY50327.1 hypothetical protein BCR33DRAFT_713141 [Rhizoclosmatium globosum]